MRNKDRKTEFLSRRKHAGQKQYNTNCTENAMPKPTAAGNISRQGKEVHLPDIAHIPKKIAGIMNSISKNEIACPSSQLNIRKPQ
jgi:hypothetical protein